MLRDDVAQIQFDSVDLKIAAVTLDGKDAKFSTTATALIVPLPGPSRRGEHHEVFIRYDGQPKKGLYFVLPIEIIPIAPKKSGPRAKPKTRATTFPSTITRTIAPPPK